MKEEFEIRARMDDESERGVQEIDESERGVHEIDESENDQWKLIWSLIVGWPAGSKGSRSEIFSANIFSKMSV